MGAAVLGIVAMATAKPAPPGLDFKLGYRTEEKLLGAPISTKESVRPDVGQIATYAPEALPHGTVRVLRDRDMDIVRFEIEYSRWENGGNDPSTGKPWAMPAAFVNAALRLFQAEWKQTGRGELVDKKGRMKATVGDNLVVVTPR